MLRISGFSAGIGAIALTAGCSLFPDLGGLTSNDAGQSPDVTVGVDAGSDAGKDSGSDSSTVTDSGSDASTCTCTNMVSAYRFANANSLGHDYLGNNDMVTVHGAPQQSTTVPPGMSGYSIQLDGSSAVCIDTGFTFDSTSDHTLCWWSQPAALANSTNQFAQACSYDTWTTNSGADFLWRINNCNSGTPANLQVPNVYSVGQWTQICQTYKSATMTRTVVVNGQTSNKFSVTDTVPIVENTSNWCIGAYGTGGFWTGLIYLPIWFDRVLSDAEIQQVYAKACCLP
jgi:hypothetical protein